MVSQAHKRNLYVFEVRQYKRLFDVLVSIFLLLFLLPFLLVVVLIIHLESPGQAIFSQSRYGLGGKLFTLYKFRTMFTTDIPRGDGDEILPDDPEVTKVGSVLRRFKIDELPQLWNVLLGNMSIVGPRPGREEQLDELDAVGKKRLLVRPGLTGLAQIKGNIYLSWEERWQYDAEYVENCSLALECWIIWRTLFVLILGDRPANDCVDSNLDKENNSKNGGKQE